MLFMRQILLLACSLLISGAALAQSQYYVSASMGEDRQDGRSPETAWASLKRVQSASLKPGDTVHFKSGDVFEGQLVVDESGQKGAPIHFTSYGEGESPVIDGAKTGQGSALAAILVQDQDHLEFSHLTVRNFRKKPKRGKADVNAYGLLVKNTGKRNLRGFEIHHLKVEEVYPIRPKKSFNETSVTGIRFETIPAKSKKKAFNTSDIYIHDNLIRETARFGIALRHRPSKKKGVTDTPNDYDNDVRIVNNRCEDLGGSCVLLNGVWSGLLEGNSFIRSGAMVEPALSVNRGSGAWFFRSKNIVAQHNISVSSRGHNDSSGMHVDFGNENILVQYNFFVDNEGYGTEILGKNQNIIWRYNISVGDGTRSMKAVRPEGGKSKHPGKTIFVSDFAVPKRIQSKDVYIYNNTYFITSGSDPFFELNGENVHVWNNVFIVEEGGRLGKKVNVGWTKGEAIDMRGNVYSGQVSPNLIRLDGQPSVASLTVEGNSTDLDHSPSEYAIDAEQIRKVPGGIEIVHPAFPAAGEGLFGHIDAVPVVDYFDNVIRNEDRPVGAGYKATGRVR